MCAYISTKTKKEFSKRGAFEGGGGSRSWMCGFMTCSLAFGKLGKFGTVRNCPHPPLPATPPPDLEQITCEVLSGASICNLQILESDIDLGIFSGTLYYEESFMFQIHLLQRYKEHEPVEH